MRKLLLALAIFIGFTSFSLQVKSQGFLKAEGKAIVNESGDTVILRGMGLGGWMLQEGYMLQTAGFANPQYQIREKIEELIGPEDTELFYETWLANHVRKIDIDSLKAWGFNSVRLPMHYNLFTLPIEDEPVAGEHTWLEKGFILTDSLISWCKQNEMYVILDLHAAPGGQGKDAGISDYNPEKPSLWESKANRDKTVALWKKLAERYVDEPWVGGYDLINETNWPMDGNTPLRDLYFELTDSIRTVDQNHIIFIEGNWFANDFTNLTPPWGENLVYSPHKYWSTNDKASIQWVLDIRDIYNVPLYFGEAGENSNVWFRDAIKLIESEGIGWAWWPMKKVESIAGPLSWPKSAQYQSLLDYWSGNGNKPTAASAKATLMDLAEGMKLENLTYQKDVIDAMFRQVYSDEAIPYRVQDIPGVLYPSDFDMGVIGSAYFDTEVANYQVSTGNYSSWNNGWVYRNDGVDLEATSDNTFTNGYNVGWLSTGEWMQYSINVTEEGVYDIEVRVASIGTDGRFHFQSGNADISSIASVPNTGDWQNWETVTVRDVILTPADKKLRFYLDQQSFNLGGMRFTRKASTTDLATNFLSAITLDDQTIQISLNKALDPIPASPSDFKLYVNGNQVSISNTALDSANTRIITLSTSTVFKSTDAIKISYSGSNIQATDGSNLVNFTFKDVKNTVAIIHQIPGKIEAEDYVFQTGIELENTNDVGGGQNIGFLDNGDFAEYVVNIDKPGIYNVNYRTAALSETGAIRLDLVNPDGSVSFLHNVSFASTGDWQNWRGTDAKLTLPAGQHRLRLTITQPLFNINWFEFSLETATSLDELQVPDLNIFPNPTKNYLTVDGTLATRQNLELVIFDMMGKQIWKKKVKGAKGLFEILELNSLANGTYLLKLRLENGAVLNRRIVKL